MNMFSKKKDTGDDGLTNDQRAILAKIGRSSQVDTDIVQTSLGPIRKTKIEELNTNKMENSIDLRKDKPAIDVEPIDDNQPSNILPAVHKLKTQEFEEPKRMPPLKSNEKQISIIIDMSLIQGDLDFLEKLKLRMLTNINNVIADTTTHTKDAKGYTINRAKLNTEIICR